MARRILVANLRINEQYPHPLVLEEPAHARVVGQLSPDLPQVSLIVSATRLNIPW